MNTIPPDITRQWIDHTHEFWAHLVPDSKPPKIGAWFFVPKRLYYCYSSDWQIGQVEGFTEDFHSVIYRMGDGSKKLYHKDYRFPPYHG